MVIRAHPEEGHVITLTAEQSRKAFTEEVQRRLGLEPDAFVTKWHAGELDRDNPDVNFLLSLLAIYDDPSKRA